MLTRYNKKTVTVITDDGRQWNVSPSFLSKVGEPQGRDTNPPNVIESMQDCGRLAWSG